MRTTSWLALALAGCAPEAPSSASRVRFDLADAPLALGDAPWPSELYRGADGRIALGELPADTDLADALRELVAGQSAFCTTCTGLFVIDGGLDAGSLPASVDATGDPVALVELESGRAIPLDVQWASGRITVRPRPGEVLRPTPHALWLTDAVRGDDGLPLSASPAFDLVRSGDPAADPRSAELLAPVFDRVDPERVVGAAVFTPGDPSAFGRALRSAVRADPPGPPSVDAVWTGPALDTLLGVPAEPGAGVDRPPAAGTEGTRAVPHDTTRVVVAGRFSAARFVEGSGAETGPLARGADGSPVAVGRDDVPFALIVPSGADISNLPVVVMHHGFNASRTTGFALADTAGRAGFAVLAIDAYQHGARARTASDDANTFRDLPGPDGFAEASALDVSGRVFGLLGAPPGQALSPALPLAAFSQFSADGMSAVALVRDGDWSAVAEADPALAGLAFDPDRVVWVGNSMGAVVGTSVLAAEPDLGAGVLNVLPGGIVDTLAESGEFRFLVDEVLLPVLGVEPDPAERLDLHPIVDLYRWILEPVDPLALAPTLGQRSDLLIQLAGHDEVAAPRPSQAAVAASGLPGFGDFALAPVPAAASPSRAAAVRFDGAMHGMLEVRWQTSVWEDPLVPPLAERPEPVGVENPIDEVHAQIENFLLAFAEDGRGAIP